ncbi:M16 family metallopeptidase [Alloiococcus sp. CFN-8]|uniref:M16 family metallopeptidase n=1 Tax=Alloiococcus sp. CFN-8 TaxID=3416081 RepID=UPI003CF47392
MLKIHKLSNNLRIVAEKSDSVKSFTLGIWIKAGSRNENLINNGISHFIEHMLFKGTKKRTALELAEAIENVGGQINAFTGREATCYYIKALDEYLPLAFDILSDMLFNSSFSLEDIEKEKGVVLEEINMCDDSPEDVLSDLHTYATWQEDSLSLPILGSKKSVSSLTRDAIVEYLDSNYTPERAVISISGNFNEEKLLTLANTYFGDWKSNSKSSIVEYSKPTIHHNFLHKDKDIEQLHISLGLKGYPLGNELGYTSTLIGNILGGGSSSILFQKLREELGLCYSIYTYTTAYNNGGTLNIYAGLSPQHGAIAAEVIKDELNKLSEEGITPELLEITKKKLKGSYILGLESTSSRMFANGRNILFMDKTYSQQDIIDKIDNITMEKVNKVIKECITPGLLNGAFVGNTSEINQVLTVIKN